MESECFGENPSEKLEGRAFLQVYRSVLNSKAAEDSLVSRPTSWIRHSSASLCVDHLSSYCRNTAVRFRQVGAYSRQIPLPSPMEPIPENRRPLPPMRVFYGGSCILCCHLKKISGIHRFYQDVRACTCRDECTHVTISVTTTPFFCWLQYPEANSEQCVKSWSSMRCDELALGEGAQRALVGGQDDDHAVSNQRRHACSHRNNYE
jgi:hypothetical protein